MMTTASPSNQRATAGVVIFLALSFLGSWFVAATLRVFELSVHPAPLGTRLFTTCLLYSATMGWQPLVAAWIVRRWVDPDPVDLALRRTRRVFALVGGLAALGLCFLSALVGWVATTAGAGGPSTFNGNPEAEITAGGGSVGSILAVALAFAGTIALVCLQSFTEEVGWRGYFLPRAMGRLGRFGGLFAHGIVWGIWYAPVLFFATYGELSSLETALRSIAFVVTCMLVGALLGWLRLVSRSLVPVVIANSTLTLIAGLPYFLHGVDSGLRSAIFGAPGWFVLATCIGILAMSRWRALVRLPEPIPLASSGPAFLVVFEVAPGPRNLH